MSSESSLKYWSQLWSSGQTLWHQLEPHPFLCRHLPQLADEVKKGGLVLVPMCGKSVDMKSLYDQGYRVVGIECCPNAVREFFSENELEFVSSPLDGGFGFEYSTADKGLRILCGDVLKVTPEMVGEPVSVIWDRGSLVAIEKEGRKKYADIMKQLVSPGAMYLLVTYHYEDWYYSGNPRNIPPELVRSLFEDRFEVRMVEDNDVAAFLQEILVKPARQINYLLTAKT